MTGRKYLPAKVPPPDQLNYTKKGRAMFELADTGSETAEVSRTIFRTFDEAVGELRIRARCALGQHLDRVMEVRRKGEVCACFCAPYPCVIVDWIDGRWEWMV